MSEEGRRTLLTLGATAPQRCNELRQSARMGDAVRVLEIVEAGVDVDSPNEYSPCPLLALSLPCPCPVFANVHARMRLLNLAPLQVWSDGGVPCGGAWAIRGRSVGASPASLLVLRQFCSLNLFPGLC